MDMTTTPTPTTTPDTDNDTPPHTQQVKHFSSYANGTLKKHHYPYHHHHHHLHQPPSGAGGIYRECLKNHAATLGGHALDGCGEFMASPTANPMDPTSLKCAACGCHRNFHRREPDDYSPSHTMIPHFLDFRHPAGRPSPSPSPPPPLPPPPPPPPQPTQSFAPQMLLALSSAAHEDQQGLNHHQVATPVTPTAIKSENLSGRKRFRTKFTQDQKEKMHSFSEKLGWKLQKCDDAMVEDFCNEIGVARGVLKVWMHNNKNTLGKKDILSNTNTNTKGTPANINNNDNNTVSGNRVSFDNGSSYNLNSTSNNSNNEENNNNASHYHHHDENRDAVQLHASTNGSSSSS